MKNPNVIYILVDDMGYGDFGLFNTDVCTPNLDKFANESCLLNQCYSSSPVCAPARASILTGRYPHRTGVIDTLETRGYDRLKLSEVTMADVFKENGYATGLVGKWHLGAIDPQYHPNKRGFNYFFGFRGGWNDYYNYNVERNGNRIDCNGEYLTDVFTQESVDFIHKHKDTPFFLHVCYNAPHFPHQAPEEVVDKYRQMGKFTDTVCKIYAMIEIMDKGVGAILNALNECEIKENTIIVFSSDNGPELGGEGVDTNRYNCNLRGEKMTVFEGGIKVPAVVGWDKHIEHGYCDEIIHGIDWFPTLLSMCNIDIPSKLNIDGQDVSVIFQNKKLQPRKLYWQWNRHQPELKCNAAVRDGNYKFIHSPVDSYLALPKWEIDMDIEIKYHPERYTTLIEREPEQRSLPQDIPSMLFDIAKDPCETNNIMSKEKEKCENLDDCLKKWFEDVERERVK